LKQPPNEPKALLTLCSYLNQHAAELAELKKQRRPGRPSSTREDLLGRSMVTAEKEYDSGFWLPDMQDEGNLELLRNWNGQWTSLSTLKYIRLSRDGSIRQSRFPPKGLS